MEGKSAYLLLLKSYLLAKRW